MFVFPRRLVVGDSSVIHPAAASFAGGTARTPGFAVRCRDATKRRAYLGLNINKFMRFIALLLRMGLLGLRCRHHIFTPEVKSTGMSQPTFESLPCTI
jgi:hypothetical protein